MAHPLATHEEHPLPARIMHWTHLTSIVVLVFTGFYIHGPFFAGGMGLMRNLHFVFMFVLILVAVIRVYWAFFGAGSAETGGKEKRRDAAFFGPQRENRGTFWGTVRYYTFLQREAPDVVKYNGLQKGTYVFWLLLIVLQAITGFALWTPTMAFFSPLTYALGGLNYMRGYHYLIMWVFIITTLIHVYLAVMHWDEFLMMFFGRESGASRPAAVDRT
ncbi:MAG TPA: Ni/Fe-hydrogenase, b-type cytochrome subunit [Coriobacteriia bacterium]|jgi:Ni/Fe-hydrogenase 1 B-type cytochrome subunit